MLTDAEADALARDIIPAAIEYIVGSETTPPFSDVRTTSTGEPLLVYTAKAEGYGAFTLEYEPLEAVKIIRVCEGYYDTFQVNAPDPVTGSRDG